MAYKYKATSDGVISKPYRYVRKGETVISDTPIEAKWLVDAKKYKDVELPIMSAMQLAGNNAERVLLGPALSSPQYQQQIDTLLQGEPNRKRQPADDKENPGGDDAQEGTGNQEVL